MQTCRATTLLLLAFACIGCAEQYLPEFELPTPVSVSAGQPAAGPRLTKNADGTINLSWMERQESGASLHYSRHLNGDWQSPVEVVTDSGMFVNWADTPGVYSNDADSNLAYWLSYTSKGTYSYQVLVAHSSDDGATWSEPSSPHNDGTHTEHGFVSTYPTSTGTGLIWLDGRETPAAGMTLRGAVLANDGTTSDEALVDNLVCDCCQTDVAVSKAGPIAVFRNRTEDEIRDIYVARKLNGAWQDGVPISADGWKIDGCPVNGPAIDASDNQVAVAWFTAANNQPLVQVAASTNAGKTFSHPIVISSSAPMGRVGVALIDDTRYAVSWLEPDKDGSFAVQIRGLTMDGQLGRVRTVGRTEFARAVPQLVRDGDNLLLAWIDAFDDSHKVVSVRVPIRGFYD